MIDAHKAKFKKFNEIWIPSNFIVYGPKSLYFMMLRYKATRNVSNKFLYIEKSSCHASKSFPGY